MKAFFSEGVFSEVVFLGRFYEVVIMTAFFMTMFFFMKAFL
jgi:hypothetical protein